MDASRDILDWWNATFSEADREWMIATYSPLEIAVDAVEGCGQVINRKPLVELLERLTPSSAARHLALLAPWFSKHGYEHCTIAFAKKSMEYLTDGMPVLDRHFAFANQCVSFYRWRQTVPGALESAIAACELCIDIEKEAAIEARAAFGCMPAHHCFRQLRIIEEKRGNYDRAIALCEQAKSSGWADDWERDITRLRAKLAKDANHRAAREQRS